MRGIKFSAKEKLKILETCKSSKDVFYVAKKNKCTERSIWRWKALYDGTLKSLENKSSRPHSKHPTEHTEEEVNKIVSIIQAKPNIKCAELYGELRTKYAYSRTYMGMYGYIKKHEIMGHKVLEKYIPKPYDTPEMLGVKMQMDVKFVPTNCLTESALKNFKEVGDRLYQYTIIDEASRERFIYAYNEQNGTTTCDFIKRVIVYFGYKPLTIQTDNGGEFTNPRGAASCRKVHAVDILLNKLGIEHQLIRAYTPRHNGKVERSHRNDQERFYNFEKFSSFEDLKDKMKNYLIRSNKIPSQALKNRFGKRTWQSPLEKREELLQILKEEQKLSSVRFIDCPRMRAYA